jgi:hypothetical protein
MKQVDARGLSCPQPVIVTKHAIQAGEFPSEALVDTVTSLYGHYRLWAAGARLRDGGQERRATAF